MLAPICHRLSLLQACFQVINHHGRALSRAAEGFCAAQKLCFRLLTHCQVGAPAHSEAITSTHPCTKPGQMERRPHRQPRTRSQRAGRPELPLPKQHNPTEPSSCWIGDMHFAHPLTGLAPYLPARPQIRTFSSLVVGVNCLGTFLAGGGHLPSHMTEIAELARHGASTCLQPELICDHR